MCIWPLLFWSLTEHSSKDSLCPSFKVRGINMSGAASHRLQRAHTWLGPAQVWELSLARASIQGMGTGHEGYVSRYSRERYNFSLTLAE